MTKITLAKGLNAGLRKAMEDDPKVLIMGEDVGKLGGVFRITDGLQKDFGEDRGIEHRVLLPGFVADPAKAVGLFDVFALSSHSEQFPISVVEAMAAGLPVAAPRVGDIAAMVASDNEPFLCAPGDQAALGEAIETLAADPALRRRVGAANRAKALAEYDEASMIDRYRALYWGVMGRR